MTSNRNRRFASLLPTCESSQKKPHLEDEFDTFPQDERWHASKTKLDPFEYPLAFVHLSNFAFSVARDAAGRACFSYSAHTDDKPELVVMNHNTRVCPLGNFVYAIDESEPAPRIVRRLIPGALQLNRIQMHMMELFNMWEKPGKTASRVYAIFMDMNMSMKNIRTAIASRYQNILTPETIAWLREAKRYLPRASPEDTKMWYDQRVNLIVRLLEDAVEAQRDFGFAELPTRVVE